MIDTQDTFQGVVTDILERYAFMFAESEAEEDNADPAGDYLYVTISFKGLGNGSVSLAAPEMLCRELAANLLGVDVDDAGEEAAQDALKELLNVVCGQLVETLFGNKGIVDLTVPALEKINREEWKVLRADPEMIRLFVEDQPLLASLKLESV